MRAREVALDTKTMGNDISLIQALDAAGDAVLPFIAWQDPEKQEGREVPLELDSRAIYSVPIRSLKQLANVVVVHPSIGICVEKCCDSSIVSLPVHKYLNGYFA